MNSLTPRQQQVLALVARGLNNQQVARALGICYQTVKNHMNGAMAKLNAQNRTEAAYLWLQHHHERELAALRRELEAAKAERDAANA